MFFNEEENKRLQSVSIEYKKITSKTVMAREARNGNFLAVKWLAEIGQLCFSAIAVAAREGHLEIVKWLRMRAHSWVDNWAVEWAVTAGQFHVVEWLVRDGCEWSDIHVEKADQEKMPEWLRTYRSP